MKGRCLMTPTRWSRRQIIGKRAREREEPKEYKRRIRARTVTFAAMASVNK